MIGVNILGDFVGDRERLYRWLDTARPAAVVVMDNIDMAREVKRRLPECDVVFRAYNPDDHQWHKRTTPEGWLARHQQYAQRGLVLQALNEPDGYGDVAALVAWCVELLRLASAAGVRLCLPNFAVGHPDTALLNGGAFDALLRALAGSSHLLGLHEYFVEQADVGEQRVGRYQAWLQRAQVIGVTAPRVVVTEFGRDVAGGMKDGWRDAGWSEAEYADRLTAAHRHWYALNDVPACVFSYGDGGGGRWSAFNVEGADELLGQLAAYNVLPETQRGVIWMQGTFVNLRAAPSSLAADSGDLHNGQAVTYYRETVKNELGQVWYRLAEPRGYAASWLMAILPEPNTPVDVPVIERLTKAELARLLELNAEIAAILKTAEAR